MTESAVSQQPVNEQSASRLSPVWVAVYLPSLALQALQEQCEVDKPCVVIDDSQLSSVVATNKAARHKGIFPGHVLRSALALEADLQVLERQPDREQMLIQDIATRLLCFSSRVSLQPPQTILIEVRASLRLFSGIENLCARINAFLQDQHLFFRYSVAPTAITAFWLAKVGHCPSLTEVVAHGHQSPGFLRALNALDISITEWPQKTLASLTQMGVATIADCRRLPRAGLLRRFGPDLLQSVAQAFGELPEVRNYVSEPRCFESVYQLSAEISDAVQLQYGCDQLLTQLTSFLRQHQLSVRELHFYFHAWEGRAGDFILRLSRPGYQSAHWQRLLVTQLECCELQQPAVAISLTVELGESLSIRSGELPLTHGDQELAEADPQATGELLDRLRARLGEQGVQALQHTDTHCPMSASQTISPATQSQSPIALPNEWWLNNVPAASSLTDTRSLLRQRPLWLLEQPVAIHSENDQLFYEGRLALCAGPERIESAWWVDDQSIRDYFLAETEAGARLWIYRQQTASGSPWRWWLQGVFG
ncbi:MAG: DNA polymerase Y family protein [Woeseiaceae bacterium]